jgi:outer membrane receptor protein involved in Fe transport
MERIRILDAGPRRGTVTKDDFRLVLGLQGELGGWDFDTGLVYHQANKNDFTAGRISTTALQNQINLNDPSAYNPFNGGCFFPDLEFARANGDCTPSSEAALDAIRIDVFRKGQTTLALADFKVSRDDLFTLPGGNLGIAAGVEVRRESFSDDRDPRLDGTFTFTDSVTGDFFGSDVLGSSPSPDTNGSREVYSGFAELFVPLISDDMNIPLVQGFDLQLAGRFERFSDINETAVVPRVAASWTVFDMLMLRGAWSQGFRAPNLVQVNDAGTTRVNTRDDFVQCFAQILKDQIASFDNCVGEGTISLRTGTNELQSEDTESINLGAVVTPTFLPGLTVTVDYWRVEQDGIVGVFGDDNAIALDLLLRLAGSSNPNVIREAPDADQIALFAGTGLEAVGDVLLVEDPYLNLDSRTVKGWDFGVAWDFGDIGGLGNFDIGFIAALLDSFFQSPGEEGQALLDAVADGTLPDSLVISDIGQLRRLNGRPKWRWSGTANFESGPFDVRLFAQYVGRVLNDSATQDATDINGDPNPDPGSFFPVDNWLTVNLSVGYAFEDGGLLDGTRVRLGVNNLFDKDPPLADESFGFLSSLHSARGRQFTFQIRRNF